MTSGPAPELHLRELARLRRVRDRIDREYPNPLDVDALAHDPHMSAGHLSRQLRLAHGESPYSYLMTRRVERAMALLRRGDLSVTESVPSMRPVQWSDVIEVDIRNAEGVRLWVDSPTRMTMDNQYEFHDPVLVYRKEADRAELAGAVARTRYRSRSGYLRPIRMAP